MYYTQMNRAASSLSEGDEEKLMAEVSVGGSVDVACIIIIIGCVVVSVFDGL